MVPEYPVKVIVPVDVPKHIGEVPPLKVPPTEAGLTVTKAVAVRAELTQPAAVCASA